MPSNLPAANLKSESLQKKKKTADVSRKRDRIDANGDLGDGLCIGKSHGPWFYCIFLYHIDVGHLARHCHGSAPTNAGSRYNSQQAHSANLLHEVFQFGHRRYNWMIPERRNLFRVGSARYPKSIYVDTLEHGEN